MNILYYGDNLEILRRYGKDETVDLVYLDPPFKSNQDYNVLFAGKRPTNRTFRSAEAPGMMVFSCGGDHEAREDIAGPGVRALDGGHGARRA